MYTALGDTFGVLLNRFLKISQQEIMLQSVSMTLYSYNI